MECYLISQGHSMESIQAIPMTHLMDLAYLFRTGTIGWQADARHSYAQYAQLHNLQQILIQVNSKNYKPKRVPDFDVIYPEQADLARLGPKKVQTLADKWQAAAIRLGAVHGTGNSKN